MHRLLPLLLCVAASTLACAKPKDTMTDAPEDPSHGEGHEHGHAEGEGHDHGHGHGHGHHAGSEHGDNGHGYKGHRFENAEEWAERFESPERTAWQRPDAVVAKIAPATDATIADLGAGTGYFAVRFAAAASAGKVYAVDIEPGMVEYVGQRAEREGLANLEAQLGQPNSPALPAEAIDIAFMCNVFHHLAEPKAYFEAVAGSLREGGRVVILDFKKQLPEDAPGPPESMRMSVETIAGIMAEAGYTLVEQDTELLDYQVLLVFERAGA